MIFSRKNPTAMMSIYVTILHIVYTGDLWLNLARANNLDFESLDISMVCPMMRNMDLIFLCGFFIQALYLGVLDGWIC